MFRLPDSLGLAVSRIYSFKIRGQTSTQVADFTYEVLQAWGLTGGDMRVNFQLVHVSIWRWHT